MSAPEMDGGVKSAVVAALQTNLTDYLGQSLDESENQAAVDAAVATLQALQTNGQMPFDPVWSVSVTPTGVVTVRWSGLDSVTVP